MMLHKCVVTAQGTCSGRSCMQFQNLPKVYLLSLYALLTVPGLCRALCSSHFSKGCAISRGSHPKCVMSIGSLQAVPVFLSEMGAPRYRGALNNMFQLATSCGILLAQIVNFAVKDIGPFQWRVSLAVAGDCQSLLLRLHVPQEIGFRAHD